MNSGVAAGTAQPFTCSDAGRAQQLKADMTLDKTGGTARVVLHGHPVKELDLTTLHDDIRHDLAQRDFTVNAMAVDLVSLDD